MRFTGNDKFQPYIFVKLMMVESLLSSLMVCRDLSLPGQGLRISQNAHHHNTILCLVNE